MAEENDPEKPTIWKEARDHVEKGRYDKAVEIYKYLLIRFNENAIVVERANANLSDIYLTLKKPDLAEIHIRKAIRINPAKPDYHYLLGSACSKQARWPEAITEFEAAIATNPGNAEFLRGLGWAVLKAGDRVRGMECLNKAAELDPLNVSILLDLANAHLFEMDFDEAKRYAQGAMLIEPGNALAREAFDKICHFQIKFGGGKG